MAIPPDIAKREYSVGKAKERQEVRGSKFYKPLVFSAKVYAKETLKGAGKGAVSGAALGYVGTVAFKYMAGRLVPYVTKDVDKKIENYLNKHPGTKFVLDIDKKQGEFWRGLFGKERQVPLEEQKEYRKEYNLAPSKEQLMPTQGWEMYVIGGLALYSALKGAFKGFFGGRKKIKELKEKEIIEHEINELQERLGAVEHQLAEKYEQQKEGHKNDNKST